MVRCGRNLWRREKRIRQNSPGANAREKLWRFTGTPTKLEADEEESVNYRRSRLHRLQRRPPFDPRRMGRGRLGQSLPAWRRQKPRLASHVRRFFVL